MKWNCNSIQKVKRHKVIQSKVTGNKTDSLNLFEVFHFDNCTYKLP